jgi:hypothetical protein
MKRKRSCSGFTIAEISISTAILGVAGGIIYTILNIGFVLFAKNTAMNVAHQEARSALLRMQQNLHSAVSIPFLIDSSKSKSTKPLPMAGIAFQVFALGPFKVAANALEGDPSINVTIPAGSKLPVVGQRLILPMHEIEMWVKTVTVVDPTTITIAVFGTLPSDVVVTKGGTNYNVPCFITDEVCYLIANGTLIYFPNFTSWSYKILAQDITSQEPFSVPLTPLGAPFNRFVAAINLSTADAKSSSRGYKASNIFLNSMVPMRARLTTFQ